MEGQELALLHQNHQFTIEDVIVKYKFGKPKPNMCMALSSKQCDINLYQGGERHQTTWNKRLEAPPGAGSSGEPLTEKSENDLQ